MTKSRAAQKKISFIFHTNRFFSVKRANSSNTFEQPEFLNFRKEAICAPVGREEQRKESFSFRRSRTVIFYFVEVSEIILEIFRVI